MQMLELLVSVIGQTFFVVKAGSAIGTAQTEEEKEFDQETESSLTNI
jgi:hypothetical protein